VSASAAGEASFLSARRRVFAAAFVGYGAYYLVRTNLPPVAPAFLAAEGYDKAAVGHLLSASGLAYGLGKFLLGNLADRGRARILMPAGLLASAALNVLFAKAGSWNGHLWLWTANGFVQGMGFGPCGRVLTRWFGPSERGRAFGLWNVSHNLGGALVGPLSTWCAVRYGWQAAFEVPALLCLFFAVYLVIELRDSPPDGSSPETLGLSEAERERHPPVLGFVLRNPWIWLLGAANFFGYVIRYALLDWGPTYLREARGATLMQGGASTFVYEAAAVVSTIGAGWLTDRLGGRRALVGLACLAPVLFAIGWLVAAPVLDAAGYLTAFAVVGFCVYPLLMLLTVLAVDVTTPAAVGTAVGFIGLFGYLGKAAQAELLGWLSLHFGWGAAMGAVVLAVLVEAVLLGVVWWRTERARRPEATVIHGVTT
jgi:OPA family glycerol-3-phosphate transporter-like MFS transporter